MVTAGALGELVGTRCEVVGQHDHLALATAAGLRRMVDGALDDPSALDEYGEAWEALRALRDEAMLLGGDRRALERELEMSRFQAEEITAAAFDAGDDEALVTTAERLRHHEAIVALLSEAANALGEDGVAATLAAAVDTLRRASRLDGGLVSLQQQAEELATLAGELTTSVVDAVAADDRDPEYLSRIEDRLALLGDLRRKYGATLDEVLEFGATAHARAAELTTLLERADRLEGDIEKAELRLQDAGERLDAVRARTAAQLESAAMDHLAELGFARPVLRFMFEPVEAGPHGLSRMTLEFASDEALTAGPVSRVASGGELSRLVLSLRLAAGVADVPVVAFDEIDAGVGGATALALGRKLASLAEGRQVLCVTHLPQVAAHADMHLVVDRDGGAAEIRHVTGEERLEELSRMLAGDPESPQGKAHAAELLDAAQRR